MRLKKIYTFLFHYHCIGFMRFCYVMLIPCALSDEFTHWWMLFMSFVLILVTQANEKGWNRIDRHTKGQWAKHVVDGEDMFGNPTEIVFACNCSVCGLDGRTETNYCPNCGAKMKE